MNQTKVQRSQAISEVLGKLDQGSELRSSEASESLVRHFPGKPIGKGSLSVVDTGEVRVHVEEFPDFMGSR